MNIPMNTPTKLFFDDNVIKLFRELDDDEVIRIELINGNKIYFLPSDEFYPDSHRIIIIKSIKNKRQKIIIDVSAIAVVCTMSRETYDLKLNRGELYV